MLAARRPSKPRLTARPPNARCEREKWEAACVYPAVKEVLLASLETDPVVRTFNVARSTTRNIAMGRAA